MIATTLLYGMSHSYTPLTVATRHAAQDASQGCLATAGQSQQELNETYPNVQIIYRRAEDDLIAPSLSLNYPPLTYGSFS